MFEKLVVRTIHFFLDSLNYLKCINFEFAVDKVDDYKNPKKNSFAK